MAATLTLTPTSYNGTYAYAADGSAFEATGSFCVDNAKVVSLAGEIDNVGAFAGAYDNTAEGLLYNLEPASLDTADDLAAAAAEIEAALTENFFPTEAADADAEGGDGEGGDS